MGVQSKNRRMNILSMTRKNFPDVEHIIQSLNPKRLKMIKIELKTSGKTVDKGMNQLLKSLSFYGFRQPMFKKSRLSIQWKILSFIIYHGIPAIWFTLNPNDLTNPVKLKLAIYWNRLPEEIEMFLTNLNINYKRIQLAISDFISSAVFFYKEISMFFEHYIKIREDSVFGRINQYFRTIEMNEYGSFYLYSLLQFKRNIYLISVLADVYNNEERTVYQKRVV